MKENYRLIDEIFHSRIRLAIVSVLISVEKIDFTSLRDRVGTTDGNMNSHLKKLEDAGYVFCEKTFINRKPVTYYNLTDEGKNGFKKYIEILETFIKKDVNK